jgi:hypothetical protein
MLTLLLIPSAAMWIWLILFPWMDFKARWHFGNVMSCRLYDWKLSTIFLESLDQIWFRFRWKALKFQAISWDIYYFSKSLGCRSFENFVLWEVPREFRLWTFEVPPILMKLLFLNSVRTKLSEFDTLMKPTQLLEWNFRKYQR